MRILNGLFSMVFWLRLDAYVRNDSKNVYNGQVLVAGATGKTGQWVVKRLLHYGVPVRVFSREKDKALRLFGEGVEIITGKIQSASDIARAVCGCDAVISALGSNVVIGSLVNDFDCARNLAIEFEAFSMALRALS